MKKENFTADAIHDELLDYMSCPLGLNIPGTKYSGDNPGTDGR